MSANNIIYVLLDFNGQFYSEWWVKEFNLNRFIDCLRQRGYETNCIRFSDIDFYSMKFQDSLVLYSSSEARYYKEYIEDILLGIHYQGGILIPNFYLFRAHHNKSFQAVYKTLLQLDNLDWKSFGTFNEFVEKAHSFKFPAVLKAADNAGSEGVVLAKNIPDAVKKAKRLSNSIDNIIKRCYLKTKVIAKAILGKGELAVINKYNAKKFVMQRFVPGLNDDWKVLIFGKKYYVLNRKVREGDFRASGSGKFSYVSPPEGLLDFAKSIFEKLNTPYASLDILFDGKDYYLIEFQALYFGLYTVLHADFFYEKDSGVWTKKSKILPIEDEVSACIANFIMVNYP